MALKIEFSEEKNELLKKTRDVCFDDAFDAIEKGRILANIKHPNTKKYSRQKVYILEINNYAYVVPYVIDKQKKSIFLKTIYPSRIFTKKYIIHSEK